MSSRVLLPAALTVLGSSRAAMAQGIQEVPNAMSAHTVFIIVITGAFLIWAVSFSLHTARERSSSSKQRPLLANERERILDEIARLELDRQSGEVDEARYKNRSRKLRGELAHVVDRLQSARAKKTPA